MKVLIVGQGVVGDATGYALEQRGHDVVYHDPPKGIEGSPDGCDCVLLCVPTPQGALGYNSRSIVFRSADWLREQGYTGLVGVRSTVIPGTCDSSQAEFPEMTWFSWPEFLQASLAREMADNPPYRVVGYPDGPDGWRASEKVRIMVLTLGPDCKLSGINFSTTNTHAEFIKYATNALLAAAVGVANELSDWAASLGIDYNSILPDICAIDSVLPSNVRVTAEGGFAGACLPKDLAALLFHAARDQGAYLPVLEAVDRANRERRPEAYVPTYGKVPGEALRRDSEGVAHPCE